MKWFKRLLIAFFSLALLGVGAIAAAYFYVLPDLPDVNSLKTVQLQTPLRIYSSDGKLISQFGEKRRVPVEYNEVPPQLINAVLDTEDARFFEFQNTNPKGEQIKHPKVSRMIDFMLNYDIKPLSEIKIIDK